MSHFWLIN